MSFWELIGITGGPFLLGVMFGWEFHRAKSISEKEAALKWLREQYEKNKIDVEEKYAGKSSDDIIDEFLGSGGKPKP